MQANATTIDSAINYLITQCTTALAGQNVQVVDGPLGQGNPTAVLCIGATEPIFTAESPQTAVSGTVSWRTVGALVRNEGYVIECCAAVAMGGDYESSPRAQAFTIYRTFDTVYRADLTLGGLIAVSSTATPVELSYEFSPGGPVCVLRWGLSVINVLR